MTFLPHMSRLLMLSPGGFLSPGSVPIVSLCLSINRYFVTHLFGAFSVIIANNFTSGFNSMQQLLKPRSYSLLSSSFGSTSLEPMISPPKNIIFQPIFGSTSTTLLLVHDSVNVQPNDMPTRQYDLANSTSGYPTR